MPARLMEDLAAEGVHVAPRLGRMRISPHYACNANSLSKADRSLVWSSDHNA